MFKKIQILIAKRAFLDTRGDIYEMIEANFSEGGSGRVSTIREIFDAWATRESSRKNSIALVHRSIVKRLDAGYAFSKAITPFIPKEEALIIEAGEASGRLAEALKSVAQQKQASSEIGSIAAAAVAEPAMSALSIFGTSWFCGSMLWPELLRVVEERYWPAWALPLIHFEMNVAHYWQFSISFYCLLGSIGGPCLAGLVWDESCLTQSLRGPFTEIAKALPLLVCLGGFFPLVWRWIRRWQELSGEHRHGWPGIYKIFENAMQYLGPTL